VWMAEGRSAGVGFFDGNRMAEASDERGSRMDPRGRPESCSKRSRPSTATGSSPLSGSSAQHTPGNQQHVEEGQVVRPERLESLSELARVAAAAAADGSSPLSGSSARHTPGNQQHVHVEERHDVRLGALSALARVAAAAAADESSPFSGSSARHTPGNQQHVEERHDVRLERRESLAKRVRLAAAAADADDGPAHGERERDAQLLLVSTSPLAAQDQDSNQWIGTIMILNQLVQAARRRFLMLLVMSAAVANRYFPDCKTRTIPGRFLQNKLLSSDVGFWDTFRFALCSAVPCCALCCDMLRCALLRYVVLSCVPLCLTVCLP
jgi:hypothetical protein